MVYCIFSKKMNIFGQKRLNIRISKFLIKIASTQNYQLFFLGHFVSIFYQNSWILDTYSLAL